MHIYTGTTLGTELINANQCLEQNFDSYLTDSSWLANPWVIVVRAQHDHNGAFRGSDDDDADLVSKYTIHHNVCIMKISDMNAALYNMEMLEELYLHIIKLTGTYAALAIKHIIIAGHGNNKSIHLGDGHFEMDAATADGAAATATATATAGATTTINDDKFLDVIGAVTAALTDVKLPMRAVSAASTVSAVSTASTVSAVSTIEYIAVDKNIARAMGYPDVDAGVVDAGVVGAGVADITYNSENIMYTMLFLNFCRDRLVQSNDSYSTVFLHSCGVGAGEQNIGSAVAKFMSVNTTVRVYAPIDPVAIDTLSISDIESLSIQSQIEVREIVASKGRVVLNMSNHYN